MVESNEKGEIDRSGENREVPDFTGLGVAYTGPGTPHKISVEHSTSSEIEDEFRNQVHFSSATKSDNFTGGSVIVCADNYAATTARRCAA